MYTFAFAPTSGRLTSKLPCTAAQSPLLRPRKLRAAPLKAQDSDSDLDQQLLQDLERMRQKSGAQSPSPSSPSVSNNISSNNGNASSSSSPLDGVKDAVDKVLIADFFFVLFALGWLGVALAERSAFSSTNLLDTWLACWQWVFQPAIGVLMLGALVSGGVSWVKENTTKQQ